MIRKKKGRKKFSPPDGVKRQRPTQTEQANATPKMGQATKSPFQRMQMMQSRQRDSFGQASYDVGRTHRLA